LKGQNSHVAPTAGELVLPSSVFGSVAETNVGLLNKAVKLVGPQVDCDPDILAALDGAYGFQDEKDERNADFDDFILCANAAESGSEDSEDDGSDTTTGEESDENMSCGENDETKSRFTNYSMSSAVTKRSQALTERDEHFATLYEMIDDCEIGALDHQEISGTLSEDSKVTKEALKKFENQQKIVTLKDIIEKGTPVSEKYHYETNFNTQLETQYFDEPVDKSDCESILSRRSTLYNHPKTIPNPPKNNGVIRLTKRAEIPTDVLKPRGPTRKQLEAALSDEDNFERVLPNVRSKDETLEEKKARKQAVKEDRRSRREEKSANKKAFKDEKLRLDKEGINIKTNLQCVSIV